MELLNATKMQAGYTLGVDASGRESVVVVVKGTFRLPEGKEPALSAMEQVPLLMADSFTGEPGMSAPLYEMDYSPIKPACDILLVGGAYAPNQQPCDRVQVGIKVGAWMKTFMVCGKRYWEAGVSGSYPSPAEAFVYQPITYDYAFGGVDNFLEDASRHQAYLANPVGRGYHAHLSSHLVDGTPMPQTEEVQQPITLPNGRYRPMSFGVLGRSWEPRSQYAGTYDDEWLAKQFPFLPHDFDNRYFQAAAPDQQIPFLQGGEEVILMNLTPAGRVHFSLPLLIVPVVFFRKKGGREERQAVIDTLLFDADKGIFTLTWRTCLPLKKSIFEIPQILVGKMSKGWWRARELGKTWYPSLAHLAREKQREATEEDA